MINKTERYIHETIERDGVVFFGLIDPEPNNKKTIEYAKAFYKGGADIILLGGSLGYAESYILDEIAKQIKEVAPIPLMLFPGNISGLTKYADALYYMSLMNSMNPYWITGAQALAAPSVKKLKIEAIPTSLIIVEPGETVGWVGEARPVLIHKPELAAAYAMAGKYMGHRMTILERGSGAPGPSPPEMFAAVKKAVGHPVICAGSSKNLDDIRKTIKAGADGIHIASLIEKSSNPFKKAEIIIKYTKKVGKMKKK
ncbi:MAG: geranylgeranylglyceryl/heptaprenylglyceryl phosphate synthase [Candidatus Aenigmarchaeota archaeon]|nr:geranylgeranylglyceryl/heptaprenylglyceryl phosphate synthase [Candidatus Aenigmarchaeota archaeon]